MILDSSAVVAILRLEKEGETFLAIVASTVPVRISAATLLECSLVMGPSHQPDLDAFLRQAGVEVVPFDRAQVLVAREAHRRYGRGSGSPARLNLGDCFSYALARVSGEPLLFKGNDFGHTDVEPAVRVS